MTDEESAPAPNASCKIMTFTPTMEEFRDFNKYLVYMESQGAHRAGLAKVIPPKGWRPRKHYDDIDDLVIPAPIQQIVTGQSGLFTQYNIQKKPMTVKEFRKLANSDKFCSPRYFSYEELERKYWKNLTFVAPIYGADVNGSLYDKEVDEWNIAHLNTILDVIGEVCRISIEGVNTPYLYFGMWKTTFAWHTEDMDLYSINYLHFGEPKSWYAVPPEHGKRLERLAQGFFPNSFQECNAFLRHKMTLISPSVLRKYGIPYNKITQESGEFMITFPYGYHAGFNHGFNCAESTNFATVRWIDYGKIANLCTCSSDMVKISMDTFVKTFQPKRYQLWKQGKDICTINHSLPTPESTPELKAWLRRRKRSKAHSERSQCTRSKSKKLKIPGNGNTSAAVDTSGAEAAEIVTDDFRVKDESSDGVDLNAKAISEEQTNVCEKQLDHKPLHNTSSRGNTSSESLTNPELSNQLVGLEKDSMNTTYLNSTGLDEPDVFQRAAVSSSNKDFQESENTSEEYDVPDTNLSRHQPYESTALKYENLEKEETSSASTDEETSDTDSSEASLEPGEVQSLFINSGETKKTKSWRHPLSKPPPARSSASAGNPQETSDEEMLYMPVVEPVRLHETEPWAKPLTHLWQYKDHNFLAEREYNAAVANIEPYCAICTIFLPYYQPDSCGDKNAILMEAKSSKLPMTGQRTKPLVSEICFINNEENAVTCPPSEFTEDDGKSQLISCSHCCVQVHSSCYGAPPPENSKSWMCCRCSNGAWKAECCLCSLRGGALKQTTDRRWIHVICAIAVPEVRFVSVAERSPIDVKKIPSQRLKLKCVFCQKQTKEHKGACVQCSLGRCPTSFHVTCAHAAGVMMEPDEWPSAVYITCYKHKMNVSWKSTNSRELSVGETVVAKYRNSRYYNCRVIGRTSQTFYEVMFEDGSFSKDTFPEDIVSRNCLLLGPPAVGDIVQVKWTDQMLYNATYHGSNIIHMYQVEFEDASQLTVKREDIYALDEELPKRVKARLTTASMRDQESTIFSGFNMEQPTGSMVLSSDTNKTKKINSLCHHSRLLKCLDCSLQHQT
ncbi:lysine-specific demethylase 4C isoform X2 [Protopterus annectens]|uniref:lysine-specific demethylase 4C isoform X2 n=1 Tax=Protopterus annectens TaxID=7888 RepID=UPI001CFB9A73|nr:lysine-specific demethylase 4C isoform X2 [Protopterus annectens]